ncbi:TNT domain-containing protein [Actinopolyspora saharensis]|uniref:TNT domain-containing protein n=1 Tax=Actinopolyspora saharensis TaxID=995062 RepID=A0A1H1GR45_9ACTN|nr:TNT domain-containing protein [Actinopolyspora saharensis]SDR15611.1 Protein of unknown function [Actinopolyspora saharensis]
MSRPTAISPEEQEQIARRIGVLLLQEAPEDWQQVTVEYRATGEYHDLLAEVTLQDGDSRAWEPPEELNGIFEHLREGMYRPDVGTWLSALYTVERPSSYRIDINFDEEPQWQQPLPPESYAEELRRYPRSEDNIPDWMSARLSSVQSSDALAQPSDALPVREPRRPESEAPGRPEPHESAPAGEEAAGPRLITARVFDDVDEQGRPLVHGRPPLSPQENEPLLRYLESAPVVLPAESYGPDLLDPNRPEAVPDSWHSDGTWLWPGAVPYYLAQYGMPPQPELVQHIRSASFAVVELDPAVREAAERAARAAETTAEAERSANIPDTPEGLPLGNDGAALDGSGGTEAVTTTMAATPEQAMPHFAERPDEDVPESSPERAEEDFHRESISEAPARSYDPLAESPGSSPFTAEERAEPRSAPEDEDPVVQEEPRSFDEVVAASRHGRADDQEEDAETIFAQLRERFDELGVHPSEYSLGVRSAEVRSLFDEDPDWIVTSPEDDEVMRFVRPDQACAYLLGSLLLDGSADSAPVPPPSESDSVEEPAVREEARPSPADELLGAPESATEAREATPVENDERAEQAEAAPAESPLGELPRRRGATDAEPANDSGGNFLFAATESRDDAPQQPGGPEPSSAAAGSDSGVPAAPAPEEIAAEAPQAAPSEPEPLAERTPEQDSDAAGTPPPGQMPPPLPKRPPRSEQSGAAEQPAPGQAAQQPPSAPPQAAPGAEGQQPPGVPPAARPGGAAPPPPPRPPHPNAPGAPGQPQPGPGAQGPAPGQAQPPQNGQQPPMGGQQPPQQGAPAAPQPPRPGGEQPIQPLRGEPPLTLYRSRQNMMLQPGAEVDRFGDPEGNVMYAIRTPYSQRSLPPQWASRNYFAYRVQRPVQVLCGTAVPWFEQPGGGTAYVLPASVNELLADGTLVALSGNEARRPPMEG